MNKLRRVKVYKSHKREDVDFEYEGNFHRWGDDFFSYESGIANFTIGIIERDNGDMEVAHVQRIRFIDKNVPSLSMLS